MNKTSFLLKFFIIVIIFSNCLTVNAGEYKSKKGKYSIKIPDKWKIKKRYYKQKEFVQIINMKDKTNYVIAPDNEKADDTIDEYQEKSIRKLEIVADALNFDLDLRNEEKGEINGIPYIKIEYSGIDKDGLKRNNIAYTLKINNWFYIITFSAIEDKYEEYSETFEEIIKSFKGDL